ncbi:MULTISPECIES: reverse transcriptase domain-containing protein [Lysinibacillus]|uniref:reverse transcriptase domain-containing protein n=1 Tax=Lysinibacillus TaxID=400634 RepID=UPI0021A2C898|nr:reverse transcriptase domain-containing protein [Lysinibacillus capsici]MCT1538768.1 reverse transcriptase domain-containing protein [Lysinibacillus capsici]MCT1569476.1 reverse transcriptase domain-containing protein [Lysinibacillus capsici]MCT1646491.1 reverse transcriptase domain-containing protein [Lysinibacillus capsici]MCT1725003.1 reverse transcriptase domain-containing protein [Lysinibacillus capsici]MCT1784615.1 reverse transcriptase domain-containing protein [Lysinibacillus capsic
MLKDEIEEMIRELSLRKINEFEKYHNNLEAEFQRNLKRGGSNSKKEVKFPKEWSIDKKHNPYYVLKQIKQISNSIFNKIISNNYTPYEPFIDEINKKGSNKKRRIYKFQIPDEAISNLIYSKLLAKNRHRFSSFSYAYRNDRNVHFAVKDIAIDIKMSPRTFIAEFDFKDFFGSINHSYINNQFNQNGFLVSDFEEEIIKKFLSFMEGEKGIPQGTSISLFLANMVCWKLDKNLEREGLRFARYADDTIIWTNSYEKINKTFDIIDTFSKETGVEINLLKSDGISLLTKEGFPTELKAKEYLEFLGYRLSNNYVSIKEESVVKIKQHISYILYKNLIKPLKQARLSNITIPSNNQDRDLLVAILQIRRYLYGNLNDSLLRNYLSGNYKRLNFKGLMSFYPLIDDENQLKELDRWLVCTILNAIKKRKKLLFNHGHNNLNSFPFNANSTLLLSICKRAIINGNKGTMEIPSFLRIYHAIKLNVKTVGIEKTMHINSNKYNY